MRKFLPLILLILLAGAGAMLTATAGDGPEWEGHLFANGDCQVGNLNEPEGAPLEGYFDGHQMIAYLINPGDQCPCSEGGFKLESVSHLLHFNSQQVPADLHVRAGLLAAEFDAASATWIPGPPLCESMPVTIIVQEPGIQQILVPTPDCEAMPLDEHYFLFLNYENGGPASLVIDGQPEPGIEYIDRGNGWEDMFFFPDKSGNQSDDRSGTGKHIVWGDVLCSAPVVPAEHDSWGTIKAMYK
jgi:hypothetical protein